MHWCVYFLMSCRLGLLSKYFLSGMEEIRSFLLHYVTQMDEQTRSLQLTFQVFVPYICLQPTIARLIL